MQQRSTTRLRELLAAKTFLHMPSVYDALTGRLVQSLGYESAYVGGYVTGGALAVTEPLLTMTEQVRLAGDIAQSVGIPVLADAGAGFGEPLHTMRTVREFCEHAFDAVGLPVRFEGEGVDEKGICVKSGKVLIEVSPDYFRPAEVEQLLGNPAKAERVLGWKPKVTFKELVQIMAKADWELAKAGK